MFSLIAFIFKIIISLGIGYIIGYKQNASENNEFQLFTSLVCFLCASLISILSLYTNDLLHFSIIFFAISNYFIYMVKNYNFIYKYKILFSIVNGIIIGLGFIFYAIVLSVIFSYVANNFDIISSLLNREDIKDDKNELDLND
tara:strand:+ start:192 stop:620 length:429 start_codon:yes stop_codon:yes gene_type:complete